MPQGLQIFDGSGNLILDYTEATCQIYGIATIVGSENGSGTIVDSRINPNSAFIMPYNITLDGGNTTTLWHTYYSQLYSLYPCFTIEQGKITWKYGKVSYNGSSESPAYLGMSIIYGGRLS